MVDAYKRSGVDVEAGYEGVRRIGSHVRSTHRPEVLGSLGGFGGMFDISRLGYDEPVLISGTDGVGTKLLIAQQLDKHDTIGIDAVAMCVNDILAQGAEPLFFLDYLALGKNDPARVEAVVSGIAAGCREAGCALIGGETAEMPDLYEEQEYDVAGFVTGAADKKALWQTAGRGDVLIGLASSGIHSNGFSLVRRITAEQGLQWDDPAPFAKDMSLGEALLTPTRIYKQALEGLLGNASIHAAAHITGGGLVENIPRMLGDYGADIDLSDVSRPRVFDWLQEAGGLSQEDMQGTFNLGIGFVLAVDRDHQKSVLKKLEENGEKPVVIGRVRNKSGLRITDGEDFS
ncbi:phosphoribosylformylglycinamidine cyclo-ligase [Alkalicoccus chagannorensis]|uniref:phosphoribosylformylglycinamidine cyclo-ligase n=1 Tax=Alkalicoccus chagannorensis TaxID=427072 RepID=UPI00040BD438|nr:phosphoribosylformylglycinamidine cyclo-ligase [Alkalicoccus chagannorensis]